MRMTMYFGVLLALATALCWAASSSLYKLGTVNLDPLLANTVRMIPGSLTVVAVALLLGRLGNVFIAPLSGIVLGVLSALIGVVIGDTLYLYAIKGAGVAKVVPVANTYPLFTSLGAFMLLGEELTINLILGTILVVIGLWFITSGERTDSESASIEKKALVLALLSAPVYAVGITLIGFALRDVEIVALNAVRFSAVSVVLVMFTSVRSTGLRFVPRKMWLILGTGGILGMTLGSYFFVYSIAEIGASRAVPLSSISPLFSTIAAALFLKEKVTLKVGGGSTFVVVGTVLITIG